MEKEKLMCVCVNEYTHKHPTAEGVYQFHELCVTSRENGTWSRDI